MSSRYPAVGALGFLAWFSTRTGTTSGQMLLSVRFACRTSDSRTFPWLTAVRSRTRVALPSSAWLVEQPATTRPPRTRTGMTFITLLHAAVVARWRGSGKHMALPLGDPRRDEQQQLIVGAGREAVAEQVAQDRDLAQEGRR